MHKARPGWLGLRMEEGAGHHRHGPKNGPACAGIGERQTGPELEARHNGKSLPGRGATVPAQPPRARSLLPEGGARATGLMMERGGLNFSVDSRSKCDSLGFPGA